MIYPENILTISNTLEVISSCWLSAEQKMQNEIENYYPDVDEEFITRMFHGKFSEALRLASRDCYIENAFLSDLQIAFPDIQNELYQVAQGLIADVTLHKRPTEKATGGDFGLMIVRPQINDTGLFLKIGDYRCGLLCQAKLKRHTRKWGSFTTRQKKILPERIKYLAILLYSYDDDERRVLHPFQWQLCASANFESVVSWLRNGSFPSLLNSEDIIQGVGNGTVGTDDDSILDTIISPIGNPSLILKIGWPDGSHPDSQTWIYSRHQSHEQVYQKVFG